MAAGPAYESIATFSPSGTNGVTFTNIPQTYTDLRVVFHYRTDNASGYNAINCYPNGNGTANKCLQSLRSSGSGREAIGGINFSSWADYYSNPVFGTNLFAMSIWDIPQYSNTSVQKLCMVKKAAVPSYSEQISQYWADTSAITSLTFYCTFGNFVAGTTATLFGIRAA